MTTFCWCGRVDPCKKHLGMTKPETRKKIGKYSGFSKHRQQEGGFQKAPAAPDPWYGDGE